MRFFTGFLAGIAVTGLLIDRGVNLPERLGRVIDTGEIERLGDDITRAVKRP